MTRVATVQMARMVGTEQMAQRAIKVTKAKKVKKAIKVAKGIKALVETKERLVT